MMLTIKRKVLTAALLLVFIAPVVRMPDVLIDFGQGVKMLNGSDNNGVGC